MKGDIQKKITYTDVISVEAYNKLRKSVNWITVAKNRARIPMCGSAWRYTNRYGKDY